VYHRSEHSRVSEPTLLEIATTLLHGLADRIIKVWRSRQRVSEKKRVARLYAQPTDHRIAPPLGATKQAEMLATIVRCHCSAGNAIVSAHANAALKLDATEYAFSSLLDELRGVMTSMPTDWAPIRMTPEAPERLVSDLADVRAA
jgi:hypothetical protein